MARPTRRRRSWCVALAMGALTTAATQAGCLAVPPPTLSNEGPVRPTIVYTGVSPRPGVPLDEWPDGGTFVIQVDSQNQAFYYDAFIDYDPSANPGTALPPTPVAATSPDPVTVPVPIRQPDPRFCHTIEILVAHQFNQTSAHVPDSLGGDVVTWFYTPGGADCPVIDAGAYQTGMFFDASSP